MKIALAQINTRIGDFENNLNKISAFVERARSLGADLVVFPELAITGYPPRDLVEKKDFVQKNLKTLQALARLSRGIAILIGYVGMKSKKVGKEHHNSVALCVDGKIASHYTKNLLPNYDVFDEARHFEPGSSPKPLLLKKVRLGVTLCEDMWNDKNFWEKRLYETDPAEILFRQKVSFFINLSASPYAMGKNKFREKMLSSLARRHKKSIFYVNLVGGNDELIFDGRSLVIDAKGRLVGRLKAYEEDLQVFDSEKLKDLKALSSEKTQDESASVFQALVLGTRDYVNKCGFKKVLLGLSGGIDSALTAVIAVEALGAENVLGVAMPSPYSSEGSVKDARELAKNLKIDFEEYPISDVYHTYRRLFGKTPDSPPDLSDENLQARIRGTLLMALSNQRGAMLLTTGNKSELAMGYCTLYGDMNGGLAVISDLPKTQVYEIARWRQSLDPVIPEASLTKPPSAELRPNQKDQDSLPPYEVLDPILKLLIEEKKSAKEIKGFDSKLVREIERKISMNEYKRRQAPPGLRVSSKAFGMGRRYPIAQGC